MRVLRFSTKYDTTPRLGVLMGDTVVDLAVTACRVGLGWMSDLFFDTRRTLLNLDAARAVLQQCRGRECTEHTLDDILIWAPLEAGSRIFAHVVNYPGHDREAKVTLPEKPFFFIKLPTSVRHPQEPIPCHDVDAKFDHEVELTVVIGKPGRNIDADDAFDHVAGYMIGNDFSYREWQMQAAHPSLRQSYGMNWIQGKGLDGACALGPWITTRDAVPEPHDLRITCIVNGELQYTAMTLDMVHKIPALIAELSRSMTLQTGDAIMTGAPPGGGLGTGKYLKAGDVVRAEIDQLGTLTSVISYGA